MEFLDSITTFLLHITECFLAIFIYEVVKMKAERNISFFKFVTSPESYYLSFIYKECRDLRLQGLSIPEIQSKLLEKFENNSLPFLLYNTNKIRNLNAIAFTKAAIEDLDLFTKYVCTSNFGDSSVAKLKKILLEKDNNDEKKNTNDIDEDDSVRTESHTGILETSSEIANNHQIQNSGSNSVISTSPSPITIKLPITENAKEAQLTILEMLNNATPERASRALFWMKDKCCHPIPDPDEPKRGIDDGENCSSLYFALVPPKEKNLRKEGVIYPFKYVTYQAYVNCIQKIKKAYIDELSDLQFNSKSTITNYSVLVPKWDARLTAIRKDFEKFV